MSEHLHVCNSCRKLMYHASSMDSECLQCIELSMAICVDCQERYTQRYPTQERCGYCYDLWAESDDANEVLDVDNAMRARDINAELGR